MIDSRTHTNAAPMPSTDDETREQLERGAKTFIRALLRHVAAVESRAMARIEALERRTAGCNGDACVCAGEHVADVTNGDGMS